MRTELDVKGAREVLARWGVRPGATLEVLEGGGGCAFLGLDVEEGPTAYVALYCPESGGWPELGAPAELGRYGPEHGEPLERVTVRAEAWPALVGKAAGKQLLEVTP